MSNDSDSIDKEIAAITRQIDTLVLDFNRQTNELKQRLDKLKSDKRNKEVIDTGNDKGEVERTELQLGDTVEITNNYLYKKGTVGVIVKLTKSRVTLRDTNNTLHTRSRNNVQRLTNINLNE